MKLKYALESEQKYEQIDEKEYLKRMLLQRCEDLITKGITIKKGLDSTRGKRYLQILAIDYLLE